MSSFVFLVAFVALTVVAAVVLWWRERGPRSIESHIRDFQRQRQALSPNSEPGASRRTTARPRGRDDWGG